MAIRHYKVFVVGGGVSGAALTYALARYTGVGSVALAEKHDRLAAVASGSRSNSQTLHVGDIETHYTLEKAAETRRAADMVVRFCQRHGCGFLQRGQKMALGVGDDEVALLRERFAQFQPLFPHLEIFDREQLRRIEPGVVFDASGRERPENIVGVGSTDDYTTIDFGALTNALAEQAHQARAGAVDVYLHTTVTDIQKTGDAFLIRTPGETFTADYVVVNAGAYSLRMAHRMGYGLDLGCLPIAGGFYMAKGKLLNGKVYTVQNPKLPFAALHGDPDMLADGRTRFGPTALMVPTLEPHGGLGSMLQALYALRPGLGLAQLLGGMLLDRDIRQYLLDNLLMHLPYCGKRHFLVAARKLVPALQPDQISPAVGYGGIRPQIYERGTGTLRLGEASIVGAGILFNMTPSPGATSCLGIASRDARRIAEALGLAFDGDRFNEELAA